jgi:hypothetical protein
VQEDFSWDTVKLILQRKQRHQPIYAPLNSHGDAAELEGEEAISACATDKIEDLAWLWGMINPFFGAIVSRRRVRTCELEEAQITPPSMAANLRTIWNSIQGRLI